MKAMSSREVLTFVVSTAVQVGRIAPSPLSAANRVLSQMNGVGLDIISYQLRYA
jgi:hypothetical protein